MVWPIREGISLMCPRFECARCGKSTIRKCRTAQFAAGRLKIGRREDSSLRPTAAWDCLSEGHPNSVLRSQDHHWARFDSLARNQTEIVFSEQNVENHEDLQHGVVAADTAPRPGPEGQMSEGRVKLLLHFREAFLVETLRVLPVLRRMVHAINEDHDCRTPGYIHIARTVVCESHSVDHPKRRVEAQRLQDHLSRKFELGNV